MAGDGKYLEYDLKRETDDLNGLKISLYNKKEDLNKLKNKLDDDDELKESVAMAEVDHNLHQQQKEDTINNELKLKIIGYFQYAMGKYYGNQDLARNNFHVSPDKPLGQAYENEKKDNLVKLSTDIYKTWKKYRSPTLHVGSSNNTMLTTEIDEYVNNSGESDEEIVKTIIKDYKYLAGIKLLEQEGMEQLKKIKDNTFDKENAKENFKNKVNNDIKEIENDIKEIEEKLLVMKSQEPKPEPAAAADAQAGGKKGRKTRKKSNRKTKKSGKKSGKKSRKPRRK